MNAALVRLCVGREDFSLPLDAVTGTLVVYGGKGMGKTNFGSVLVEELARHALRFCVVDPLDVWWGLQHGATKQAAGIDVVILGGRHGDIPIEPTAGEVVADFVADETVSTVVVMRRADGKMWTAGERIRFMTAFCTRLFERQGEARIPIHLVIDEAGKFVPQQPAKGDLDISKCIGAIETLVEWGRNVGIGVTLITQRSARMNKSVSELADAMVAFRTTGPNSIAAIVDWFGEHVPKERQKEHVEALRSLPRGTALVVSPGWLEFEGKVAMRARQTFDSSATPEPGKSLHAPGKARKPDLELLRDRMAETIEKAQLDDPTFLRRRLAQLEKELAAARAAAEAAAAAAGPAEPERVEVPVEVEVPVLTDEQIERLWTISRTVGKAAAELAGARGPLEEAALNVAAAVETWRSPAETPRRGAVAAAPGRTAAPAPYPARTPGRAAEAPPAVSPASGRPVAEPEQVAAGLTRPQQKILDVLATFESIRVAQPTRGQVALLAGVSPNGSGFEKNVGVLRRDGWIVFPGAGRLALTDEGRAVAAAPLVAPTSADLHATIFRVVSGPQTAILRELIAVYPEALSRPELAARVGVSPDGSGYEKNLGTLRSYGFAVYPDRGLVAASDMLFLDEAGAA